MKINDVDIVAKGRESKNRLTMVQAGPGIITEVGKGKLKFVHSSSSRKHFGVTETNYYKSGYPKRYLTVVRM